MKARFNEQMEPIYKLLKEVENITLSEDVLEPKPVPIPHLHPKYANMLWFERYIYIYMTAC